MIAIVLRCQLVLVFIIAFSLISPAHAFEYGAVFVAEPPYNPVLGDTTVAVDLGGIERTFDFGGSAPLVNNATGVSDIATINVWDPVEKRARVLTSGQITASGVWGRVFKTGNYTAVGYVHGDGIVEGKLRTQVNSYPIPARRRFVWELTFRFGGVSLSSPWVYMPRGVAPATIWQLKTEGYPPTLVMAFDTDPDDDRKLAISFDSRLDPSLPATNLGRVGGLGIRKDITVIIDAFLDERSLAEGGSGYLRISVDGNLVIDRWGPVLQKAATRPYQWSVGMYLFSNENPLPFDRFVFWKNARQITYD